ncbi:hypothetical protein [Jiangella anatolica]|nr:hypothetical protein [Jiangella anatolica]
MAETLALAEAKVHLEALEETIAVLADTDAVRQLIASDAQLARGEEETEQELAEAMQYRAARER